MADIEIENITPTGNWDYTGGDIKVPAPAVDTDASTKKYVDDSIGVDWTITQDPAVIHATNYTDTNTQLIESDITTMGFTKDVEVDWTVDQGATNIHSGNYTDTDTTDHTALSNIGTQTHTQLETAIDLNTAKETDVDHNVTTNITIVEAPTNVDVQSSDGSNDTIAAANVTNAGVMTTTMYDEHVLNNAKNTDVDHNVTTNLSLGTKTATTMDVNSSDGTNATLIEADTTNAGLLGSDKWDEIVVNSLKATNIAHPLVEEAVPSGAVFTDTTYTSSDFTHNSLNGLNDGTDYEHITQTQKTALHSSGADTTLGTMTQDINMNSSYQVVGLQAPAASGEAIRQTTKITEAKMEAADDHVNDNTQAHSDYLLNNASDTTSGTITAAGFTTTGTSSLAVTTVADHGTATTDQVVNVCYGTSATPPTASTTTEGALYVQYTS